MVDILQISEPICFHPIFSEGKRKPRTTEMPDYRFFLNSTSSWITVENGSLKFSYKSVHQGVPGEKEVCMLYLYFLQKLPLRMFGDVPWAEV